MRQYEPIWVVMKERYPLSVSVLIPTNIVPRTIKGVIKEKSKDKRHALNKEKLSYILSSVSSSTTKVTFTLSQTYRI